jgi:hypothetical protein
MAPRRRRGRRHLLLRCGSLLLWWRSLLLWCGSLLLWCGSLLLWCGSFLLWCGSFLLWRGGQRLFCARWRRRDRRRDRLHRRRRDLRRSRRDLPRRGWPDQYGEHSAGFARFRPVGPVLHVRSDLAHRLARRGMSPVRSEAGRHRQLCSTDHARGSAYQGGDHRILSMSSPPTRSHCLRRRYAFMS